MVEYIVANMQSILIAVSALLGGVIGILLLIPGEQGESFLTRIRDFIAQFIKKP